MSLKLPKSGEHIDRALADIRARLKQQQLDSGTVPFKDQNRELQELAREVFVLRQHNLQFTTEDAQDQLLMFAEAAMILVCIERFLRAVLGPVATKGDTLHNLLEKVFSDRRHDYLEVPGGDRAHLITMVTGLRNGMLHGDFEQLASISGCASTIDYFQSRFAKDLEILFNVMQTMMRQIDPRTGSIYEEALVRRWRDRFVEALSHRTNSRARIDLERSKKRGKNV